ncbi:hypothetical protein CEXT_421031 [Caerostris extrusa]|uniref:Uncharacterized protein n=1 Tax=Caerostris extrusa TaxID=172846 RepID=A0AAV4S0K6_CAEEX|nr:hypothetical protein CEXT_421031 [Caerostris extrusa]
MKSRGELAEQSSPLLWNALRSLFANVRQCDRTRSMMSAILAAEFWEMSRVVWVRHVARKLNLLALIIPFNSSNLLVICRQPKVNVIITTREIR